MKIKIHVHVIHSYSQRLFLKDLPIHITSMVTRIGFVRSVQLKCLIKLHDRVAVQTTCQSDK